LHHAQLRCCVCILRVYEHRKTSAAWDQLTQNLDSFRFSFSNKQIDTGRVAARLIEACDQTSSTGFLPIMNTRGIVADAAFAANAGGSPPTVTITAAPARAKSPARPGS